MKGIVRTFKFGLELLGAFCLVAYAFDCVSNPYQNDRSKEKEGSETRFVIKCKNRDTAEKFLHGIDNAVEEFGFISFADVLEDAVWLKDDIKKLNIINRHGEWWIYFPIPCIDKECKNISGRYPYGRSPK